MAFVFTSTTAAGALKRSGTTKATALEEEFIWDFPSAHERVSRETRIIE